MTALIAAIQKGLGMVALELMRQGADVTATTPRGTTALTAAIDVRDEIVFDI